MIVIITDATKDIGYGHLKRCLSLAFFYRRLGMSVTFLMRKGSAVVKHILDAHGMDLIVRSDHNEVVSCLLKTKTHNHLVIIDHYEIGVDLEEKIFGIFPILAIDDLCRPHWCDVLVDQTMNRDIHDYDEKLYHHLAQPLIGIDYTLVDPVYHEVKSNKDTHHILITFGATDPEGTVLKVLGILERKIKHKTMFFHVPLSSLSPCVEELEMLIQQSEMNIQLYLDLPDLSALYKKCGIAIGAPGTSLLERMYCGMLNMTLIVAQNQRQVGRNMDALGAAVCLGDIQDFDADLLVRQLTQMIESSAFRKKLQEKARGLVDGKGAVRVVKHTIDLISSITLRKVKKSDLDILYHWQYEKGARRFFRVPTPPTKAEHQAWFDNMLSCNDAEMFIIEWCDMPAGYVRLNNKGEKKEISVLVVQNFQGFGFAKASLLKILKVKKQTYSAVIHPENKASIGLFTSLGFKSAGKGGVYPDVRV